MHLKAPNSVGRRANRARPITVHFPIPRKAISKLRTLAIGRDPRLVDLGVLAVQISDDESIVLGIELEKTKRKGLSVSRNIPVASSTSITPRTVVNFQSPSRNVSSSCGQFYSNQFVTTTTRNEPSTSKTKKPLQNAAVKKKAKETLNAARRGSSKGKSRGGKGGQTSGAVASASTWEMVYSHIGLPGDYRRKSSNPPYIEPNIASQASGIANVPIAKPGLSREITSAPLGESTKKRESAASSPPHKSPGNSALYSEDDSSVSSSPCSHSPMNQEEILNLFVDSNFSATSILKQLAESRVKEDENNSDDLESSGKQTELDRVWSTWHTDTSGLSPNTSCSDDKSKITMSVNGAGLSLFGFTSPTCTSTSTTTLTEPSSTVSMKRPSTLLEESSVVDSSNGLTLSERSTKRPRRSFAELEVKREMLELSNKLLNQELEKASESVKESSAKEVITLQASSQFPETTTTPTTTTTTTTDLPTTSTSTSTHNAAVRNYNQFGYYYSSEDLKALGSKASKSNVKGAGSLTKPTKSESVSPHQPSLYTSSNGSVNWNTTSVIQNKPSQAECDAKPIHQHDSASSSPSPTAAINEVTTLSPQCVSECNNNSQNESEVGNGTDSFETGINNDSNILDNCVSSSTDNVPAISPCSQPNSSTPNSNEPTINTPPTSSSPDVPSSCNDIKPPENVPSYSSVLRRGSQCYALSYVYPMGTVWYPYVAITPYATLGNNQTNVSEMSDKDQPKTSNGLNSCNTQYIDLASSLRYWQQLSLLYKNKLLAPTACIPNLLTGSDKNSASTSSLDANTVTSTTARFPKTSLSSCSPVGSSDAKPVRRASVIVTAKDMESYCRNEFNNRGPDNNRVSTCTPESTSSLESNGSDATKTETPLVIDNSDRLIEEQCNRMSEVFNKASDDITPDSTKMSNNEVPAIPSLSFIPDSSIAYVNIGNNSIPKKPVGNGKESKGKSKRRKSNKSV